MEYQAPRRNRTSSMAMVSSAPYFQSSTRARTFLTSWAQFLDLVDERRNRAKVILDQQDRNNGAVVQTINQVMTVGAFISGVQAQIISFTYQSNNGTLQLAANAFAFIGLTLDIIGTTTGMIHALIVQRSMNESADIHSSMDIAQSTRDRLRRELVSLDPQRLADRDIRRGLRRDVTAQIQAHDVISRVLRKTPWQYLSEAVDFAQEVIPGARVLNGLVPRPGQTPIVIMGGGVFCMLLSVLCLVAESQPRVISVSCLVISCLTGAIALLSAVVVIVNELLVKSQSGRSRRFWSNKLESDMTGANNPQAPVVPQSYPFNGEVPLNHNSWRYFFSPNSSI